MKRDFDLIRKMVLAIEDAPSGRAPNLSFEGHTLAQVRYHAYLLVDAGLARGSEVTSMGGEGPEALIANLTWAGHEFAEAARDDTRWMKAMGVVREKGGAITIDLLKQLLGSLMKGAFGLP
jgi:hypothetical protein